MRVKGVDYDILETMSDGRRYTQQYLYDDVPELEDYSSDWIRKRVSHLYENALIEKVGSSSMYVITDYGRAALEVRYEDEEELTPVEFGKRVREVADERDY